MSWPPILPVGNALTTPERIIRGIRAAIEAAAEALGIAAATPLRETDALICRTTRATNAVVTKSTAKTWPRDEAMAPGDTLSGPAIIEEPTTVVVHAGCTAPVSAAGNFILCFA